MKTRKLIALMSAVLMLCAMIPMGGLIANADTTTVLNVNFDDGTTGNWKCSESDTIVVEDGAMKWTTASWKNLYHGFNVETNLDFTLTFKMKAAKAGTIEFKFLTGSWSDSGITKYTPSATTEWQDYSYSFNAGTNTGLVFLLQSHIATDIWLDDIVIAMDAISTDSAIPAVPADADYSEDFESGDLNGWYYNNSIISAADLPVANEGVGNYAMKLVSTYYSYTYKTIPVLKDTEYKVTFSVLSSALRAPVKAIIRNSSDDVLEQYSYTPTIGAWQTYSFTFRSGNKTSVEFLLQAQWETGTYYFDNLSVVMLPASPEVPDNAIYFEDFEDEHTWASGPDATLETISSDDAPVQKAQNGNYVIKHTIPSDVYTYISDKTGITVEPNTDYIVSFDMLNTSNGWPLQVIIAENYWLGGAFVTSVSQGVKPNTTAWETYSIVFNTGDHNKIWLGAKSQWASTTVYFDNFWIAPLSGEVTDDGYMKNGDFEQGSLEWLHTSNTAVVADPTDSGMGNVIKTDELVSGAHMFSQPVQNLIVDEEYVLSFKVYGYGSATNNAFWVAFPSAFTTWSVESDMGSAKYNNYTPRINMNAQTGAWHYVNITFTAKATTALIDFKNYRADQGFYYFDDISVTHVHKYTGTVTEDATCGEEGVMTYTCICGVGTYTETIPATGEHVYDSNYDADCNVCAGIRTVTLPVSLGGKSVSEDVYGLAFLFDMNDITIGIDGYTAIYDDAQIGGYTLVEMGAVMSNQSADATADRANAGAEGSSGTIDIHAEKLWDQNADNSTASFAVRIINIPAAHTGTTIYARPYFVIKIGEIEYTYYGEVQSASYDEVLNS